MPTGTAVSKARARLAELRRKLRAQRGTMSRIAVECGVSRSMVTGVIAGRVYGISPDKRRAVLEMAERFTS